MHVSDKTKRKARNLSIEKFREKMTLGWEMGEEDTRLKSVSDAYSSSVQSRYNRGQKFKPLAQFSSKILDKILKVKKIKIKF